MLRSTKHSWVSRSLKARRARGCALPQVQVFTHEAAGSVRDIVKCQECHRATTRVVLQGDLPSIQAAKVDLIQVPAAIERTSHKAAIQKLEQMQTESLSSEKRALNGFKLPLLKELAAVGHCNIESCKSPPCVWQWQKACCSMANERPQNLDSSLEVGLSGCRNIQGHYARRTPGGQVTFWTGCQRRA